MKTPYRFVVALIISAMLAGCGGGSGLKFSDLFDDSARAEGTGIQGFALVRAVVILATHEATPRQRQVAEQNGRRAVARLQARRDAQAPTPALKKKARKKTTVATAKAKPAANVADKKPKSKPAATTESEIDIASESKPKPRKPLSRIIAVATEKDEKTDPKAAKAIMLFDTQAQRVIGNKVYDIEKEPQPGDEVRFETYSTSYVGASL